jgi:hypothetical protein
LGELSPIGRLFSLGYFLNIAEVAQICKLRLSSEKATNYTRPKLALATFWAIFSQTHLVTLVPGCLFRKIGLGLGLLLNKPKMRPKGFALNTGPCGLGLLVYLVKA